MKILVTGGAGFIGSHVVDRYLALGHEVHVADNLSTGKRDNVNRSARLFETDICGPELRSIILREKYDVINHHAAQISVVSSMVAPEVDAKINVLGLLNVIRAAADSKTVKKFMFISSGGAVYGEKRDFPIAESEIPEPLSPYAITKLAGELYVRSLCGPAGMNYVVLRYSNVFGPRQDPHGEAGVVAIFSKLMISGKTPNIYGDGSAVRDYVYVKDVAEVNALALDGIENDVINVCTATGTSVNKLFAMLAEIAGFGGKPNYMPKRPGELDTSIIDNRKCERLLNFKPVYSIMEGLRETVHYFKMEKSR